MSQQLYLFPQAPTLPSALLPTALQYSDAPSEVLLEQTRELFQHHGSNAELMSQIMTAIRALDQICEQSED